MFLVGYVRNDSIAENFLPYFLKQHLIESEQGIQQIVKNLKDFDYLIYANNRWRNKRKEM